MCVVILFASLLYWTLRLGISPMPSGKKPLKELTAHLPSTYEGTIVDLGSGWGQQAYRLARWFPHAKVIGIERSFVPYLVSKLFFGRSVHFIRDDFRSNLPQANIYFCYLFVEGMNHVVEALNDHNVQRAEILAYAFSVKGMRPDVEWCTGSYYPTMCYRYSWILEKSSS